jgi:hypothetical protein
MNSYSALLRIRHPSIESAELTRQLGIEPLHEWTAGSTRVSADETGRGARRDTYWLAPLGGPKLPAASPAAGSAAAGRAGAEWPPTPAVSLEMFLLGHARQLRPHKEFLARLNREGGSVDLVVTMDTTDRLEVDFPPGLMRALADVGVTLSLEVVTTPTHDS